MYGVDVERVREFSPSALGLSYPRFGAVSEEQQRGLYSIYEDRGPAPAPAPRSEDEKGAAARAPPSCIAPSLAALAEEAAAAAQQQGLQQRLEHELEALAAESEGMDWNEEFQTTFARVGAGDPDAQGQLYCLENDFVYAGE